MTTKIGEHIKVMAVFDGALKPVKFKWKGRVYPIKEITHSWTVKDSSASVVHFAVSDGVNIYGISYNQSSMKWTIEEALA